MISEKEFKARALFIADRIDTRSLETTNLLGVSPLIFELAKESYTVVFRYGVIVLFNVSPMMEIEFLEKIKRFCVQPFETAESEEVDLIIGSDQKEGMLGTKIYLNSAELKNLQLIAEVLAKSVVLGYYETKVLTTFDNIEPIAENLKQKRKLGINVKGLIHHIGDALLNLHKMVGRVEAIDKPELLWESPELERFYLRLEDEYEIRERHTAIERKVELIYRTAETVLDLLQTKRALRVEWYIVALIVIEIFISIYELFIR